jgi:hypothetical protein
MVRYRATEVNDILAGRWRRLWHVKSGRAEPEDLSGHFKVQLGRWTEEFNLRWLAERHGTTWEELRPDLAPLPEDALIRPHPEGFLVARRGRYAARPDALGRDAKGLFVVEAKHVADREVPEVVAQTYLGQLFVTMHVLGVTRAVLSVIYGADRQTAYGIRWSEATWKALESWIEAFDSHILLDVEPYDPLDPPYLTLPLPKITNRWRPERERRARLRTPAGSEENACVSV